MAETKQYNFQSCCRLCLVEKSDSVRSIFGENTEDRSLQQKILRCLSVRISKADKLSTMICKKCATKVNEWQEYRQECEENQKKLEQQLKSSSVPGSNIADTSLYIKDEPIGEVEENNLDGENDVVVKVEPENHEEEPMEEEFNDFPPPLTPHPIESSLDVDSPAEGSSAATPRQGTGEPVASNPPPAEKTNTSSAEELTESDRRKIQFAAGLKLLEKNSSPPISSEPLSKIELSYLEKCKAMVNMHNTLDCACHNVRHPNLKGLLSHLRAMRIWFPVFTCYNCMITFTDRSSFTKHNKNCPSNALATLTRLSNLKKRSDVKTRLYQNYKCMFCRFMYSFHEDYCKHVEEEHMISGLECNKCEKSFESSDDFKRHVFLGCWVEFYCDICFVTTKTLEDFQRHAVQVHDRSEGFVLLQDDNYYRRKPIKEEPLEVNGQKRERRSSYRAMDLDSENDESAAYTPSPKKVKNIPQSTRRKCKICDKEYSNYPNMMRHFKTHTDEEKNSVVEDVKEKADESLYSCPDCGGMYSSSEWRQHLADKHVPETCSECGKIFQFKTELDQHRSVHLNLKVYRDSKTKSYKSAVINNGGENELEVENGTGEPNEHLPPVLVSEGEDNKPRYSCVACNKVYTSYGGIWDHNRRKHPERKTVMGDEWPKQCKYCDKMISSGGGYHKHKMVHQRSGVGVGVTKGPSLKPKRLEEKNEDDEDYHTCKRCFKVFSTKYNLKNHMKCHGIHLSPTSKKGTKRSWCERCHMSFPTVESLAKHKEAHSEDEMPELTVEVEGDDKSLIFTCDVCVSTFSTKTALKKHKEKHLQETTVVRTTSRSRIWCKHCKTGFENATALAKHVALEHDEKKNAALKKKFSCTLCKKAFTSSSALSTHSGWHKRGMTFDGSRAAKVLRQDRILNKLAAVMKVKQEPKEIAVVPRFRCKTCLAELPNETALQVHILEKHRSVSAIMLLPRCDTCDKDFRTQDEYEKHKRLHEFLERQKSSEQEKLLQNEKPRLQNEKPRLSQTKPRLSEGSPSKKAFPCKYCKAAFSRSDTLNTHVKQFHKEHVVSEFRCTYCDRLFDKQNSLSIHLKVHEKQRAKPTAAGSAAVVPSFSCSICNAGFELPKDLRAHTISAHPF